MTYFYIFEFKGKNIVGLFLFSWFFPELHREGVHAVTSVGRSESLPMKYMTEMSATIRTGNLRPSAISIDRLTDSTLDSRIEWWPTASRVEFELTSVEVDTTLPTWVDTLLESIRILSDEWHLSALTDDDASLFWSEGIVVFHKVKCKEL